MGQSLEELIAEAAAEALESSGVAAEEIDAVYIGNFNSGMYDQEFPASLILNSQPALRFKPATRVENACASGSAAIQQGINVITAYSIHYTKLYESCLNMGGPSSKAKYS